MRWVEMAAFTPVMRTHEGNRPKDNFQFDQDDEALQHLAKFVSIYVGLKSYIQDVVNQCANLGFPCQRPLFMHYEDDPQCYDLQYQYLFGEDILVAPVHQENMEEWLVYLPNDEWVHLFTKEQFIGGWHTISAPIGKPAVFYRKKSSFSQLFNNLI
jgi:alpha-glucosidase